MELISFQEANSSFYPENKHCILSDFAFTTITTTAWTDLQLCRLIDLSSCNNDHGYDTLALSQSINEKTAESTNRAKWHVLGKITGHPL